MKTRITNNPFIPSALALSLMACGLLLPSMGSAAIVAKKTLAPVKKPAIVRQSVDAPQILVDLRGNTKLTQGLMLTLDKLAGTTLHVSKAVGPNEYQLFTATPLSVQALQNIVSRIKKDSNVLSAAVIENNVPQYLIAQSAHRVVLKGNGLIKSSVPIVRYRWKQIAGPALRINDASAPNLATTPTTGTSTTPTVADPAAMNPGELFAGLFPTNIQPCQTSSSTTSPSATGYGTTPSGSTPSSSTPAPSGPTFSFAGSFSSSFTKSNPDGTVNTGTFATSFSGAWGTNKNGFFCSLNQDPGTTTTTPGGNTSTTPVTGNTPSTTDTPLAIDPTTGAYIDPTTGQDMSTDPATGLPMNSAGQDVDPTTGLPVSGSTTGSTTPVTASSVRRTTQPATIMGFRLIETDRAGISHVTNVYVRVHKPSSTIKRLY